MGYTQYRCSGKKIGRNFALILFFCVIILSFIMAPTFDRLEPGIALLAVAIGIACSIVISLLLARRMRVDVEVQDTAVLVYKGKKVAVLPFEKYRIEASVTKTSSGTYRVLTTTEISDIQTKRPKKKGFVMNTVKADDFSVLVDWISRAQLLYHNPQNPAAKEVVAAAEKSQIYQTEEPGEVLYSQEFSLEKDRVYERKVLWITGVVLFFFSVLVALYAVLKMDDKQNAMQAFLSVFAFIFVLCVFGMVIGIVTSRQRAKRMFSSITVDKDWLRIDGEPYRLSEMKQKRMSPLKLREDVVLSGVFQFQFMDNNGLHQFAVSRFYGDGDRKAQGYNKVYNNLIATLFRVGFVRDLK